MSIGSGQYHAIEDMIIRPTQQRVLSSLPGLKSLWGSLPSTEVLGYRLPFLSGLSGYPKTAAGAEAADSFLIRSDTKTIPR